MFPTQAPSLSTQDSTTDSGSPSSFASRVAAPPRSARVERSIERLFDRINYERVSPNKYELADFELQRMRQLLELLGDPHLATPCVHIAGTKGKGSTSALLASALTSAGHRTGLFTSPHIHHFEERITVDCDWTDAETLAASFDDVWRAVEQLDSEGHHATYFEITTALAWDVFRRSGCDVAVVEVGLGGRLDCTNLCDPLVTVVTSISRDHTKLLGDSIAAIAAEKAGIFKPNVPAISGADDDAAPTIEAIAAQLNCELWTVGREIIYSESGDVALEPRALRVTTPRGAVSNLPLMLPGHHQSRNAAIVAAVCDQLPDSLRPTQEAMTAGFAAVVCPLRVERVWSEPCIVLDAAHNGASIAALLETVRGVPAKSRRLIFGTSRDKHLDDMLDAIDAAEEAGRPFFDEVVVAAYSTNPRALPTDELASIVESRFDCDVRVADSPTAAIHETMARSHPDDLIVVTGSFFLSGEIREQLLARRSETDTSANTLNRVPLRPSSTNGTPAVAVTARDEPAS